MKIKIVQHITCSLKSENIGQLKNKRFEGQNPVLSLAAGQMIDKHRHSLQIYSPTVQSGSKMVPKEHSFVDFDIKHFASYGSCITFVSFKLNWEF